MRRWLGITTLFTGIPFRPATCALASIALSPRPQRSPVSVTNALPPRAFASRIFVEGRKHGGFVLRGEPDCKRLTGLEELHAHRSRRIDLIARGRQLAGLYVNAQRNHEIRSLHQGQQNVASRVDIETPRTIAAGLEGFDERRNPIRRIDLHHGDRVMPAVGDIDKAATRVYFDLRRSHTPRMTLRHGPDRRAFFEDASPRIVAQQGAAWPAFIRDI